MWLGGGSDATAKVAVGDRPMTNTQQFAREVLVDARGTHARAHARTHTRGRSWPMWCARAPNHTQPRGNSYKQTSMEIVQRLFELFELGLK